MRNHDLTTNPQNLGLATDLGSVSAEVATTTLPPRTRESDRPGLSRFSATVPEESLVIDGRSRLTPAQVVEGKLMTLLQGASLPVSHLQTRGLVRNYRQS